MEAIIGILILRPVKEGGLLITGLHCGDDNGMIDVPVTDFSLSTVIHGFPL